MTESNFTSAVWAAYQNLPAHEKIAIDALADKLRDTMYKRKRAHFGKQSAIELLGKLGVFVVNNGRLE